MDSADCEVAEEGARFVLDLGGDALEVSEGRRCFVDDICMIHSWETIGEGVDDRLFLETRWNAGRPWAGTWDYVDETLSLGPDNMQGSFYTHGSTHDELPAFDGLRRVGPQAAVAAAILLPSLRSSF